MALFDPLNDKECLELAHKEIARLMVQPWFLVFLYQFQSTEEFAAYLRSLEQRDDLGDPDDGPRLPCKVSQRLRFDPSDPNCFERTVIYAAGAEILDPATPRSTASLVMDQGWHTFPVEFHDGRPHVVVLDPVSPPYNAMLATAYRARRVSPTARRNLVPWFEQVASNACLEDGGEECYQYALDSLRNALITGEAPADFEDLDYVIARAAEDAEYFGGQGRAAIHEIHRSLRNLSIRLDKGMVSRFVDKLANTAEKLAPEAIRAALVAEFGPAAAIALQGVDLAIAGKEEPAAPSTPGSDAKAASAPNGKAEEKPARSSIKDYWQRMTLIFRPELETK